MWLGQDAIKAPLTFTTSCSVPKSLSSSPSMGNFGALQSCHPPYPALPILRKASTPIHQTNVTEGCRIVGCVLALRLINLGLNSLLLSTNYITLDKRFTTLNLSVLICDMGTKISTLVDC